MPRINDEDTSSERELRGALKHAIRPTEGETTVEFCRRLVAAHQFGAWNDGQGEMLIDTFSASAVVAVHDALKDSGREKLLAMPMLKATTVCLKIAVKNR